ncbi:MAG: hypothetical protein HY658_14980 [Actinobacteria bacterium]|nr:hypothetical protein [Actinomycetota bacterium]
MRRSLRLVVTLAVVAAFAFSTVGLRSAAASHTAPCTYSSSYLGMRLTCYGSGRILSGRTPPFWIRFGGAQTSDGVTHRAHVHSWTASTMWFHLDGEVRAKEVTCSIPLWGGACRYVYS